MDLDLDPAALEAELLSLQPVDDLSYNESCSEEANRSQYGGSHQLKRRARSSSTATIRKNLPEECARKHTAMLSQFVTALWKRSRFCDVTIRIGSKTYPAHRLVLMCHSQLFQAKLGSRKLEEVRCEVVFDASEIPEDIFDKVLVYMYEGKVDVNKNTVGSLIRTCRILGIRRLEKHCEDYLWNLHPNPAQNLLAIMKICGSHDLFDLRNIALRRYMDLQGDITQCPEFMNSPADDIHLMFRVTDDKEYSLDALEIFTIILRWLCFDPEGRSNDARRVLKCCRLETLSTDDLRLVAIELNSIRIPTRLYNEVLFSIKEACYSHVLGSLDTPIPSVISGQGDTGLDLSENSAATTYKADSSTVSASKLKIC